MKIKLDKGALMPIRGHKDDAGLDLRTPVDVIVHPRSYVKIDTGVHFDIAPGLCGFLKSKSGLNVNKNITSDELKVVESFEETERGDRGFGSTGN